MILVEEATEPGGHAGAFDIVPTLSVGMIYAALLRLDLRRGRRSGRGTGTRRSVGTMDTLGTMDALWI
ncbi:MAG: hypothetical protein EA367_18750, partial [Leptolyngbya sp. DLM2.Bin15]